MRGDYVALVKRFVKHGRQFACHADNGGKMVGMRKPIGIALIAALPLEFACLWFLARNFEGLPSDAGALERFLDFGVEIVHWPAKLLISLFNALAGSQSTPLVRIALISLVGYLDWAILICAIFYGIRFLIRTSAPPQA
jgi:hypothetical protein